MTIQVITYGASGAVERDGISFSPLHAPYALDDFDINIIDLSVPSMWTYKDTTVGYTDSNADFKTIHKMVMNKKKSIVVYALPQNEIYHYNMLYTSKKSKSIKDILSQISENSIKTVVYPAHLLPQLAYERTCTTVAKSKYSADMYFETATQIVTKSEKSEKATTIQLSSGVFATTLKITVNNILLKQYIATLFEPHEREAIPEWMNAVLFGDDAYQKSQIEQCQAEIEAANARIEAAENKLRENAKLKSILYTNGEDLVEVVFEMLEKLLGYDLSSFVDDKKEDFLIRLPSYTFIGEIKGVTSNVKYEHISQVELHYRGYLDRLAESGTSENVKQLLIMNPFRTKALDKRDPVHCSQIDLAVRNGCLIIETTTLLKLYERFCEGKVTTPKCIDVFWKRCGLLCIADFDEDADNIEPYLI